MRGAEMIVENANIQMRAGHQQMQRTERKQTLTTWNNRQQVDRNIHAQQNQVDNLHLSNVAQSAATQTSQLDLEQEIEISDSLNMLIIRRMVKELTGQELQLFSPKELQGSVDEVRIQQPLQPPAQQIPQTISSGMIYEQSMSFFESESSSFSAEGIINTKDGQSLSFSVSLSMSRSFYLETSTRLQMGEQPKVDPLVINFDGNAAELSTSRFQFDIDANGSLDQIATLKSNSGMLALDKNQDGQVNDGSELFGTKTGDGFSELAVYDEDQNHFIDEADSIYHKLRIWQRHADGSQQLIGLGEKNIGAIYLGHLTTPFQLKAENDNQSLGEVASSGIYLKETGEIGTIQQINFTV
jgi:hypothetical protein